MKKLYGRGRFARALLQIGTLLLLILDKRQMDPTKIAGTDVFRLPRSRIAIVALLATLPKAPLFQFGTSSH
jgi:hypothetical protein